MGPTRKRDLTASVVAVAVLTYVIVLMVYPRAFPPITVLTGISLLGIAVAETLWGRYVRSKINNAEIGDGSGRLHPLAVARTVMIAKASAWVGALVLGWWLGMFAYLLVNPDQLEIARKDTPGTAVAAASALALVIAALWLQHCCTKPEEPPDDASATGD
jgi:Na+/melibiose symporter-like transporter